MSEILTREMILKVVGQEGYVDEELDKPNHEITLGGFGRTPVSIPSKPTGLGTKVRIEPKKHRPTSDEPVPKRKDLVDDIFDILFNG